MGCILNLFRNIFKFLTCVNLSRRQTGLKGKHFLKTVLPVVLGTALISALVTAAVLYSLPLLATVTILPPDPDADYEIKAYFDQNCTQEVTQLDFGSLKAGRSSDPIIIYAKNTGNRDVTLNQAPMTNPDLSVSFGWNNLNSTKYDDPLQPGDIAAVSLTLYISPITTDTGDRTFEIVLQAVS